MFQLYYDISICYNVLAIVDYESPLVKVEAQKASSFVLISFLYTSIKKYSTADFIIKLCVVRLSQNMKPSVSSGLIIATVTISIKNVAA